MAFRRRGFAPGRNSVFNVARRAARSLQRRTKYPWATATWINQALTVDGNPTTLALVEYADFVDVDTVPVNAPHRIHRFQLRGHIVMAPQVTGFQSTSGGWAWAISMADAEDTAVSLWDASNNTFANHQVLKWQCEAAQFRELASADVTQEVGPRVRVSCDLRFRRPLLMRPGMSLRFTAETSNTLVGSLAGATLTAIQRVVAQPAQMGR